MNRYSLLIDKWYPWCFAFLLFWHFACNWWLWNLKISKMELSDTKRIHWILCYWSGTEIYLQPFSYIFSIIISGGCLCFRNCNLFCIAPFIQKKWTTRCFIDCGNLTYSGNIGTTWQTDLLTGRAINSCWTLSTSVVPWWNPLWDCWQAILMLITCLQPLPYQGLNLPTLGRDAAKEGENGEDGKKSFPDALHFKSYWNGHTFRNLIDTWLCQDVVISHKTKKR